MFQLLKVLGGYLPSLCIKIAVGLSSLVTYHRCREYHRTIRDVLVYASPAHAHCLFSYLLIFCEVSNASPLWDDLKIELCMDYTQRGMSAEQAFRNALRHINSILKIHYTLSVLIFAGTNFHAFAQKSEKCAKISSY